MGIYQPERLKIRPRTFISDLWVRHIPEEGRAEVKLEGFRTDVGRGEVSFRMADDGKMQGMLYLIPEGEGRAAEPAKPLGAVIADGKMPLQPVYRAVRPILPRRSPWMPLPTGAGVRSF